MKKILCAFMSLLLILSVFSVAVNAMEETTLPVQEEQTTVEVTEPTTEEANKDTTTEEPTTEEPTTEEPTTEEPTTEPVAPPSTYETWLSLKAVVKGVSVEWRCDGEADYYNVYRRKEGEQQAKLIATVTSKSYIDQTVQNNTYYKYHVESVVGSKVKGKSEGVLTRYLAAPKNLKAVMRDGSWGKEIALSWSAVEGATRYDIYRRVAGESEYEKITYIYANQTKITITLLPVGYARYAVVAVCGNYVGALDQNGPLTKYFKAVTRLYDVSIQNGISFKWYSIPEATGYRIYRRAGGEKYWTYLGTVGRNVEKYQDKNVINNKYYKYIVRAVYGTVYGPYREDTPLIHYVTAPKLQALANATNGVYIRWQTISGLNKYNVYKRGAGGTSYGYMTTASGKNINRVKDTDAVPEQYYRYVVAVISKTGHVSAYSNSLVIKHTPLGSSWNKESVLKYYNYSKYLTNRDCKQFGITHWQNLDSHSATGNNASFAKEFKNAMASVYIPKSDPITGYVLRDTEESDYWRPKSMEDWDLVKSATIQRGKTYDTIKIVLKDITVSKDGTTNNFLMISPNYIDFGELVQDLKNENIVYSGNKPKAVYKNFIIVMNVDKNGRFISGTHICQNATASLDLEFYNGCNVEYKSQFDTYLTYDYFKY